MDSIESTKPALKTLAMMPRNVREWLKSKIAELATDPARAQNFKKLVDRLGYRLRVGDWRVIYDLDSGRLVVGVLEIGARGGVYE